MMPPQQPIAASSSRLHGVDWLRGVALALIVWFHSPPALSAEANDAVWYGALALFFCVSGILMPRIDKPAALWRYLRSRMDRLLLTALVVYLVFYALWLVVGRYHAGPEDLAAAWYEPLTELLQGYPRLVCAPLWFVVALWMVEALTAVLCLWLPRWVLLPVGLAMALWPIGTHVWTLQDVCQFFVWHAVGTVLGQCEGVRRLLRRGADWPVLRVMNEGGIIVLGTQNYVIGLLKMLAQRMGYDLMAAPLWSKFVVAACALTGCYALVRLTMHLAPWMLHFNRRQSVEK